MAMTDTDHPKNQTEPTGERMTRDGLVTQARARLCEDLMRTWEMTAGMRKIADPDGDVPPLLFLQQSDGEVIACDISSFIEHPDRMLVGAMIKRLVADHLSLPASVTLMTMAYRRSAGAGASRQVSAGSA